MGWLMGWLMGKCNYLNNSTLKHAKYFPFFGTSNQEIHALILHSKLP